MKTTKENGTGNIMEALLADRYAALASDGRGQRSEEARQLRFETKKSMNGEKE